MTRSFFLHWVGRTSLLWYIGATNLETLDRADELHGKHTLFGRCVGDTVYSGYDINLEVLES